MAHVTKFSRAASGHMFKHFERAKDTNGDYIKFSNQSIEPARTSENYNLAPARDISQGDYIRLRCADPGVFENKRKDLNVMCSWVVTLPQELPVSEHRQFFEESYKFMATRYGGEQNVVSAYVHMDEVRPHMHFAFVPIVENKQKGGYKVSAKDAVNRRDLQTFHADLDRHMERVYGHNIGILNEATKEGNKSIEELKRGTAQEQLQTMEKELGQLRHSVESLQLSRTGLYEKIEQMQQEHTTATQEARTAMQQLQEVQKALGPLQEQRDALERQIEAYIKMRGAVIPVKERKNLSGKVVEVTMTKEVYDACVSAQHRADHADLRAKEAEKELERLRQDPSYERALQLEKRLDKVSEELRVTKVRLNYDRKQIEWMEQAFTARPELKQEMTVAAKIAEQHIDRNIGR